MDLLVGSRTHRLIAASRNHQLSPTPSLQGALSRIFIASSTLEIVNEDPTIVLAWEQAIRALDALPPRLVEVVERRFFTASTIPEPALALEVSTRTIERDWEQAKEWLSIYLSS